jgi:hypothetical protein
MTWHCGELFSTRGEARLPGVHIERRQILWMTAAGAAALLLGRTARAADGAAGRLDWDAFVAESTRTARSMLEATDFDADAYVQRLASIAVRLSGVPDTPLVRFEKLEPKVYFAPSFRGVPFVVVQWRLEPRAILPPHCHPNASVCTLGVEGEARVRNFELAADAPAFDSGAKTSFEVRETHDEIVAAGRVNTLTPARDNVHCFEAGDRGARGIDISTLHAAQKGFSFLRIDPKAKDERRRTHEATWIGEHP